MNHAEFANVKAIAAVCVAPWQFSQTAHAKPAFAHALYRRNRMKNGNSKHKMALVTGGAGFLGSHLCRSLLRDGHHVVCLDNFQSGSRTNIQSLLSSSRFT